MKTRSNAVTTELKRIAKANGGILQPAAIVEAATPEDSPLHSRFEWDDSKASHEYRLFQARQLIRVSVHVISGVSSEPERIWVSLRQDREAVGGGYRPLVEVLTDENMRQQLLHEALEDMEYFSRKYARLEELAGVFKEMRRIEQPAQRKRLARSKV